MHTCPHCDKAGSEKSIRAHIWKVHTEAGRMHKSIPKGTKQPNRFVWNRGLTKDTDSRVANNGRAVSDTFQEQIQNGTYVARAMGEIARQRLSVEQSLRNRGGRCKWFVVGGQSVQGTWERDFATMLTEQHIEWTKLRCGSDVWFYTLDGKQKAYTPDFYLPELDLYVELKGYWWGRDLEKMEAVFKQHASKRLLIIRKPLFTRIRTSDDIRGILEREQVWSLRDTETVEN